MPAGAVQCSEYEREFWNQTLLVFNPKNLILGIYFSKAQFSHLQNVYNNTMYSWIFLVRIKLKCIYNDLPQYLAHDKVAIKWWQKNILMFAYNKNPETSIFVAKKTEILQLLKDGVYSQNYSLLYFYRHFKLFNLINFIKTIITFSFNPPILILQ